MAAPEAAVRASQDFPGAFQARDQLWECLGQLPPRCCCSPRHRPWPPMPLTARQQWLPLLRQVVFPHQGEDHVVDPVASEQAALLICDALTSERLAALCVHVPAAACTVHLHNVLPLSPAAQRALHCLPDALVMPKATLECPHSMNRSQGSCG